MIATMAVTTPKTFCNRGLREHLGRDTAEQAARGGGDLEQHAEAHVDQLLAGARGRHRARRGDDGREADGRRDREREVQSRD